MKKCIRPNSKGETRLFSKRCPSPRTPHQFAFLSVQCIMGFYSVVLFPHLLDWMMGNDLLAGYRRDLLAEARGNVLEIGFGTGVNLQYYPTQVRTLTTVDPNAGMNRIALKRLATARMPVEK